MTDPRKKSLAVNVLEEDDTSYYVHGRKVSRCLFNGTTESLIRNKIEVAGDDIIRESSIDESSSKEESEVEEWIANQERWNAMSSRRLPQDTIHSLVANVAKASPEAIAITCPHISDGPVLTYGELVEQADRLAQRIRKLKSEQRQERAAAGEDEPNISGVGVMMTRAPNMIVCMLGALMSGSCYVSMDPSFPPDRLAWYAEDSNVDLIVCDLVSSEMAAEVKETVLQSAKDGRKIKLANFDELMSMDAAGAEEAEEPSDTEDNPCAYIIYTSGSTGKPKGVELGHLSVVNFVKGMHVLPGTPKVGEAIVAVTTICFDIHVNEIWGTLTGGGTIALVSKKVSMDGQKLRQIIEDTKASHFQATPSTFRLLIEAGWCSGESEPPIRLMCGGEPLPVSLAETLVKLCGPTGELWNMYGPTETTVWSTVYKVTPEFLATSPSRIPIGVPILNTTVYILDPESLEQLTNGSVGVVYLGGSGMARGYRHRPELTSEKWVDDPFMDEVFPKDGEDSDFFRPQMYCTGDLGTVDPTSGLVECLGRADNQVKIRGYRIELGECEGVADQFDSVQDVAILAIAGEDGEKKLVGYVVPSCPPEEFSFSDLKAFMAIDLPLYMVPSFWVMLEALPLLPNGKVNRNAFPTPDWEAAALAGISEDSFIAPANEAEETIHRVAMKVLGLSRLSVEDNFFLLGGNSLFAVRLHTQLSDIEFLDTADLKVTDIFQKPTVRMLAQMFSGETADSGESKVLIPLQPSGKLPTLFFVHPAGGLVFPYFPMASKLAPHQPFYALQDPNLDSSEPVDTSVTVADMARTYIKYIKEKQPKGPYYIGGWSLGGNIAHEMAVQMHESGDNIGLVMLIDSTFQEEWNGTISLQKDFLNGLKTGMVRTGLKQRASQLVQKKETEATKTGLHMRLTVGSAFLRSLSHLTPAGQQADKTAAFLLTGGRSDLDEELKELAIEIYNPDTGLKVKDRWFRAHLYHDCFTGKGFINWMVKNRGCVSGSGEAVAWGKRLLEANVIRRVRGEEMNRFSFYRFVLDDQPSAEGRMRKQSLLQRTGTDDDVISELEAAEEYLRANVEVGDHKRRGRRVKQCFVGEEAVQCLIEGGKTSNASSAVKMLESMQHDGVFYHATHTHGKLNAKTLLRFAEQDLESSSGSLRKLSPRISPRRSRKKSAAPTGAVSEGFENAKSAHAKRLLKLLNWHMTAGSNHTPRFYDGRVALLSTRSPISKHNQKQWQSVCGALSITYICGNHYTLVNEPYISYVSRAMVSSLQEAQNQ